VSAEREKDSRSKGARNLRDEQKAYTRRRLIETALEVFSKHGYANSRVEDITAALGSSRATFYRYFDGKADVVKELVVPVSQQSVILYGELAQLATPSRDELRAWMERKVSWWETNMQVLDIAQQVLSIEPAFTSAYMETMGSSADAMCELLVRLTGAERSLARLESLMLIFQLERFCFFWLTRDSDMQFDRAGIIDVLTDMWWRSISSSESKPN
jgi:AcrR family transcriptional regulator